MGLERCELPSMQKHAPHARLESMERQRSGCMNEQWRRHSRHARARRPSGDLSCGRPTLHLSLSKKSNQLNSHGAFSRTAALCHFSMFMSRPLLAVSYGAALPAFNSLPPSATPNMPSSPLRIFRCCPFSAKTCAAADDPRQV